MPSRFNPYLRNYQSLSVGDLLEAREAYHVHLMHLDNVFSTAVGRFRIRVTDDDSEKNDTNAHEKRCHIPTPRTLLNTIVQPWSWPCVLVFVKEWLKPDEIKQHRDDIVPPFLYLPDGRIIPTCVLQAELYEGPAENYVGNPQQPPVFASGQPIVTEVQGEQHVGTITCIVTDGVKYYAMTNQHVAGEKGTVVFADVNGELIRIGVSAGLEQKRRPFEQIFAGLSGKFAVSTLDFGLIELDSLAHWTSNSNTQVHDGKSTTKLDQMVEFRTDTANLDWIGCKTIGFGAASGPMHGEIKALFYRYRSVGGLDYVSDFLIGDPDRPTKGKVKTANEVHLGTRPGDSGALWCVDPLQLKPLDGTAPKPRPFGVQWGGQKLTSGNGSEFTRYALASSLAVACRELDVELVADWNTEHTEYWGTVGHYKIAEVAISMLKGDLKDFMHRHLTSLTYQNILEEPSAKDADKDFIPLADVPDLVWKKPRKNESDDSGDTSTSAVKRYKSGRRGPENPNHYADLDLLDKSGKDQLSDKGTDASAWQAFYRVAPVPPNGLAEAEAEAKKKHLPPPAKVGIEYQHQGLLPFRVWQIFDELSNFAEHGDAKSFLCAAGILAHYVGDACQPLHGSRHSDGLEGATTGVHSSYEDVMVDYAAKDIADGLTGFKDDLFDISSGENAAEKTIETMKGAAKILHPDKICKFFEKFKADHGFHGKSKLKSSGPPLAKEFLEPTIACMKLGCTLLASLWTSAFKGADASKFTATVSEPELMAIYQDHEFLASYYLDSWIKNVSPGAEPVAAD